VKKGKGQQKNLPQHSPCPASSSQRLFLRGGQRGERAFAAGRAALAAGEAHEREEREKGREEREREKKNTSHTSKETTGNSLSLFSLSLAIPLFIACDKLRGGDARAALARAVLRLARAHIAWSEDKMRERVRGISSTFFLSAFLSLSPSPSLLLISAEVCRLSVIHSLLSFFFFFFLLCGSLEAETRGEHFDMMSTLPSRYPSKPLSLSPAVAEEDITLPHTHTHTHTHTHAHTHAVSLPPHGGPRHRDTKRRPPLSLSRPTAASAL